METMLSRLQRSVCFATVAELGSFTAAARQLGCSKAHVSRQVAQLERELGSQLLHRSTRRLSLTDIGRRYATHASALIRALEAAEQEVSLSKTVVAGALRLTAATSFGEAFLVALVEAFRSAHPEVRVELDLSIVQRDLERERFDFGFRATRTLDDRIVARAIGVIRELPVASPALFERHRKPRRPSELAALPCLRNTHFQDDAEWVLTRGARSETVRVHGDLAINHFGSLKEAALIGAGVARLPRYLVQDVLDDGRLIQLLPEWQFSTVPVYLVHPQRHRPTLLQQRFREHVIAWFDEPERVRLLR